jgi:hypothetical protein
VDTNLYQSCTHFGCKIFFKENFFAFVFFRECCEFRDSEEELLLLGKAPNSLLSAPYYTQIANFPQSLIVTGYELINLVTFPANIGLNEDQQILRETALKFGTEKIEPFASEWDSQETFPVNTLREAAQLGFGGTGNHSLNCNPILSGIYVQEQFGGSNLSRLDTTVIFEALSSFCVSTTAYISIHKYRNDE